MSFFNFRIPKSEPGNIDSDTDSQKSEKIESVNSDSPVENKPNGIHNSIAIELTEQLNRLQINMSIKVKEPKVLGAG